jgi:protein-S-isoprenylcysteine O-methyltransferase Ste14
MTSLAAKALISLARRTLLVSLLLFISACSFHFWQAWAFLILFFVSQLLIGSYLLRNNPSLLERRLKVGPAAETRACQKLLILLIGVSVASSIVISGLDHRFNWSHVAVVLIIAAEIVLLFGFLLQFYAFKANSFASAFIALVPEQKLISTGPYAVVRHPMYSGALVVNLSIPIALGSWWGLPFSLAWLSAVILRVLDEERLLRQSLPGYEEYCRKVPYRLIPYIW